jgi:hypothetical protein
MKNLFAIAAIVLATVSFSACGGKTEGGAEGDTTSTMAPETDTTTMMAPADSGSMAPADSSVGDSAK